MIVDGFDLTTIGFVPEDRSPSRRAPDTSQLLAAVPGAWRRLRLGRQPPDARVITVRGAIHAVGISLAELQDRIDEVKWRLRPDTELAIEWSDQANREYLGYRESLQIDDIHPGWVSEAVRVALTIVCPDPFGRDTSETTQSDNGAPPRVITPSVGTAPMPLVISITGSASALVDPTVEYRNGADVVLASFTVTGSHTGSDALVINTETLTCTLNGANNMANFSGEFFDVNPGDGDYLGSPTAPDVRLTASAGSANLFQIAYRRRWW